jgi:hypothetical protein
MTIAAHKTNARKKTGPVLSLRRKPPAPHFCAGAPKTNGRHRPFVFVPTPGLLEAKTTPGAAGVVGRNRPLCIRFYDPVLLRRFCCCVSQILCLFTYPRHAPAPSGYQHRGATVGMVSLGSQAASRDVRLLRRMTPAITGWPEDPAVVEATLDPKGNPGEEVQPAPNRRDDLSRHPWTECLRMLSDHQRRAERRQQVHDRSARREPRRAPETGTPQSPSIHPNASRCSPSPETLAASTARVAKGDAS